MRVSYRIVKQPHNRKLMVIVTCPRCGEEGNLTIYRRGKRLRIVHDYKTGKGCYVGRLHPSFEFLAELLKKAGRWR